MIRNELTNLDLIKDYVCRSYLSYQEQDQLRIYDQNDLEVYGWSAFLKQTYQQTFKNIKKMRLIEIFK